MNEKIVVHNKIFRWIDTVIELKVVTFKNKVNI